MKAKLTHYVFWAAILTVCFFLSGCSNLVDKSAAYRFVHEKTFWAEYKGGGPDAAAWANYKAHQEAEHRIGN